MENYDFDVAVIGGGSAGYATARTTAAAGKRTVIIEAGGELGGLCILRGCMPTKALLHAADVRFQARRSKLWGLEPGEVGFDLCGEVMRRKAAMVEEFASYRRGQLQDGRFELIRALARFRDPHTLELDNGQSGDCRPHHDFHRLPGRRAAAAGLGQARLHHQRRRPASSSRCPSRSSCLAAARWRSSSPSFLRDSMSK